MALGTLFALAPPRRPKALAFLAHRLGLLVNELPFLCLIVLLASTSLVVAQGDLGSGGAWALLVLAVAIVAGISLVVRRALRTAATVERAMGVGLGAGWRSSIAAPMPTRKPPIGRIVFGLFARRRDVERVAEISYGEAGTRNTLDLYRHRSEQRGPVLIHLHGGSFVSGRKSRQALPLLYRLASRGWVCVSANYRYSPPASFTDQVTDAKAVIAWVREHGPEYGVDASVIFVAGSSAGAHLTSTAALTPDEPVFQPGFESTDTSVAGAIALGGYFGGRRIPEPPPTSPGAYVGPDAPPFFVAHGDRDTVVPVQGARRFVEKLSSVSSSPVVYAELPGALHTFDYFSSIRFEAVIDSIEDFAAWVQSSRQSTRGRVLND